MHEPCASGKVNKITCKAKVAKQMSSLQPIKEDKGWYHKMDEYNEEKQKKNFIKTGKVSVV